MAATRIEKTVLAKTAKSAKKDRNKDTKTEGI
jgi:hypothetical protein